jgi:hypothetical protein
MVELGKLLVSIFASRKPVTFEYVCRKGKEVERYYQPTFDPAFATRSGFKAVEIAAWVGGKEELRMKLV